MSLSGLAEAALQLQTHPMDDKVACATTGAPKNQQEQGESYLSKSLRGELSSVKSIDDLLVGNAPSRHQIKWEGAGGAGASGRDDNPYGEAA